MDSTVNHAFLTTRVHLLAHSALRLPVFLFLISCLVCLALYKQVPSPILILWVFLATGAGLPRAAYSWWLLYRCKNKSSPRRDYKFFIIFAVMTGLGVGLSAPLFFPYLHPPEQAFIGMVLTGLVAGGVATSGSSPLVLAAYALAALLPLGIAWRVHGHDTLNLVTWLVLLFSLVMLFFARDGKRVLFESFIIRCQRDEAYARLEQKNLEIMQINARAESLAETKTRVLAAASHDLRQPLHALSIYSAVLAANPTKITLSEVAENIDQTVRSLGALLDALLDLSQLDSETYPKQIQSVDLVKIARQVCREFEHTASQKGLQLNFAPHNATVLTDPLVLTRIMRNLMDNAIKYTEYGQVNIGVEVDGMHAVLIISDTGKGIAQRHLKHVFEEFYQIDNPGRDRRRGLGLGLSIVQRMVSLLDATLDLQSELGVGTVARLILPMATQPETVPQSIEFGAGLQGKHILLIDDEEIVIASMVTLMEMWGIKVSTASTLLDAQKECKRVGVPDLVITDLRLADGAHGVDWVATLREQFGPIPALVITGETVTEQLGSAVAAGLQVFHKPVSAEILFDAIMQHIFHER